MTTEEKNQILEEKAIRCPICGEVLDLEPKFGFFERESNFHPFSCSRCGITVQIWTEEEGEFKVGQKVKWNDPCISDYAEEDIELVLNRIFVVQSVDNRHGIAYIVEEGGGSEAEVYTDELEAL